jgi:hypothetical protein
MRPSVPQHTHTHTHLNSLVLNQADALSGITLTFTFLLHSKFFILKHVPTNSNKWPESTAGYTLVTGLLTMWRIKGWFRSNVTGLFGGDYNGYGLCRSGCATWLDPTPPYALPPFCYPRCFCCEEWRRSAALLSVSCALSLLCCTNGAGRGKRHRICRRVKRKEIIWDPKVPKAFNKTKKPWRTGGTGERNKQNCRRMHYENGRVIVICQTGENEDEEKQWNRRRWVIKETFMYFGNTYILSWDQTTELHTF